MEYYLYIFKFIFNVFIKYFLKFNKFIYKKKQIFYIKQIIIIYYDTIGIPKIYFSFFSFYVKLLDFCDYIIIPDFSLFRIISF